MFIQRQIDKIVRNIYNGRFGKQIPREYFTIIHAPLKILCFIDCVYVNWLEVGTFYAIQTESKDAENFKQRHSEHIRLAKDTQRTYANEV